MDIENNIRLVYNRDVEALGLAYENDDDLLFNELNSLQGSYLIEEHNVEVINYIYLIISSFTLIINLMYIDNSCLNIRLLQIKKIQNVGFFRSKNFVNKMVML